jgi:hypothetical protein
MLTSAVTVTSDPGKRSTLPKLMSSIVAEQFWAAASPLDRTGKEQDSNNASKAAKAYLDAIVEADGRPFAAAFMQGTFDRFWAEAQYVTGWTNAMLQPPPRMC